MIKFFTKPRTSKVIFRSSNAVNPDTVGLSVYNKHHELVISFLYTYLMLPTVFLITLDFSLKSVNLV